MSFTFLQRRHIDSKDALYLGCRVRQKRDDESMTKNTDENCVYVVVHAVSEAVSQLISSLFLDSFDDDR